MNEPANAIPAGGQLKAAAFWNTAAQMTGRILAALGRLVITATIVRAFGKTTFVEYVLIFGILGIAEWTVEFGLTEVFVRDLGRSPQRREPLLRILTATKLVQVPLAALMVIAVLMAMRYPAHVVEAGAVAASSLLFVGLVLVYHVHFQSTLTLYRGVTAEVISVAAMIPMVIAVAHRGGGLVALLACHLASRAIYFAISFLFGRKAFALSVRGVTFDDVRGALASSLAIGTIGFLIATYENIDILVMSKIASTSDLAYYAAAQKFVWPLMMALSAICATLYPIAASYWPNARAEFESALQRALDSVLMLAGVAVVGGVAGAAFLMGLISPQMVPGAAALEVLIVIAFAKAISWTIGPVLYVVHAQNAALRYIAAAVVMRGLGTALVARRYGYVGVALVAIAVEVTCLTIPILLQVRRITGYRWRWSMAARIVLAAALAIVTAGLVFPSHGFMAALLGVSAYLFLLIVAGALKFSELRAIVVRTPA